MRVNTRYINSTRGTSSVSPGMRVNTRYMNSTRGTSSSIIYRAWNKQNPHLHTFSHRLKRGCTYKHTNTNYEIFFGCCCCCFLWLKAWFKTCSYYIVMVAHRTVAIMCFLFIHLLACWRALFRGECSRLKRECPYKQTNTNYEIVWLLLLLFLWLKAWFKTCSYYIVMVAHRTVAIMCFLFGMLASIVQRWKFTQYRQQGPSQ